jgi:hypothetical protein
LAIYFRFARPKMTYWFTATRNPILEGEAIRIWFCLQLDAPVQERWDACPIQRNASIIKHLPVPAHPYAFVRDSPAHLISRPIDLPKVRPDSGHSELLLAYRDLIEQADEIHVIDSACFDLVESLHPKGKLFPASLCAPGKSTIAAHQDEVRLDFPGMSVS